MIYDVDGFTKPNTFLKDLRFFNEATIALRPDDCDYYAVGFCI